MSSSPTPSRVPPGLVSKVLILLGAFFVILLAVGFALPTSYVVERTIELAAPPDRVAPLVTDFEAWPAWQPWGRDDQTARFVAEGPPGPGQTLAWTGGDIGEGRLEVVAVEAGKQIEMIMDFGQGGPKPKAVVSIDSTASGGSRVIWRITGETALRPVGNYLGLLMDGIVGPDLVAGLARLKAQVDGGGATAR